MKTLQNPLITRLNERLRRARLDDGKRVSDFPKFKPGMTTENYLQLFAICTPNMLPFGPLKYHKSRGHTVDLSAFDRPAPFYVGPEVIEEITE